jgi:hypothetical protein
MKQQKNIKSDLICIAIPRAVPNDNHVIELIDFRGCLEDEMTCACVDKTPLSLRAYTIAI